MMNTDNKADPLVVRVVINKGSVWEWQVPLGVILVVIDKDLCEIMEIEGGHDDD